MRPRQIGPIRQPDRLTREGSLCRGAKDKAGRCGHEAICCIGHSLGGQGRSCRAADPARLGGDALRGKQLQLEQPGSARSASAAGPRRRPEAQREASDLANEHGARVRRATRNALARAFAAPLLAFLAGSHLLIYVLSLVSPAAGRADRAAIAALVCLAGLVVQTLGRMQRSSHRAVETAALFGALLAAGLATAYAVGDGAAGLLLMALFTFALAAAATPNLPLLLLAPWALASLLLWQADQITILFALQALLAVAVALGLKLARQFNAVMNRRHVRFWQQRLAQRRQQLLAQGRARYIAAAGHDLRQPLHAMSFLARALVDRFAGDREVTVVLSRLEQATNATDRMFRDLLQLAQIDSSSISLKLADVPLASIFESLQSTHTPVATRKRLAIQFYKTDLVVRSDPVALLRILNNFVSNAVRYTDRGSVEIRATRHGAMVQVRVRDTGPGIAPADQQAVFEEFRQLSGGRAGSGLGLAIARRLASALGHRISLESAVGRGSTFSLTLAAVDAADTAAVAPTTPVQERLILFVENDDDVRKAVRPVMESWGYSVIDATNGQEAEERLSELMTVPDVMIVDQDLDGGEVADDVVRRIRNAYGEAIPSLVVTGNLNTAVLGDQLSTLHKPLKPDELRQPVEVARRAAKPQRKPSK